jgi:hypothetical protein
MDFGWALTAMEDGESVKREAWGKLSHIPEECASLALVSPAPGYEKMFIVTTYAGTYAMYNASHSQLRATDWVMV